TGYAPYLPRKLTVIAPGVASHPPWACRPNGPRRLLEQGLEMLDGALGLLDRAALHGEHDVARALLADDLDNFLPVDHPIPAGAADGRAGDLAALGAALLDGDVLGVQVHQAFAHALQPLVGIVPAQEGVAGVEVD